MWNRIIDIKNQKFMPNYFPLYGLVTQVIIWYRSVSLLNYSTIIRIRQLPIGLMLVILSISWVWLRFFFWGQLETPKPLSVWWIFIEKNLKTDCLLKVHIKCKMCVCVWLIAVKIDTDDSEAWYTRFTFTQHQFHVLVVCYLNILYLYP